MSVDLSSRYLGMTLRCPLVAAASPVTGSLDTLVRLEEMGAGAVVLPSLFEEQIEHEEMAIHRLHATVADSFAEAQDFFPQLADYNSGPGPYLELVAAAGKRLSIPVIASLNGTSRGGWVRYACRLEEAGARALELNIYRVAADPETSGADVEAGYLRLVEAVRAAVSLPLAVKLGPFFTSLPHLARRLVAAGADGLVLFNRFVAPDIDLDNLEVVPHLALSDAGELGLPLRWMALLRGRVQASLAASSGVHGADGAIKLLLAGADAVQVAAALLRHGPERLGQMRREVAAWLEERGYAAVEPMKGSLSQANSPQPAEFERAQYMKALASWSSRHPR